MPLPLIPLIALGLSAIGTGIGLHQSRKNRKSQEQQNTADREFQYEMYGRQRRDALTDFRMANEYNSPEEQMNRLRQAGLNPHLVYGKGADMAAAQIRGSSVPTGNQPAPKAEFNPNLSGEFLQTLATHAQLQQSQAATDNLHQQVELSKKEAILKEAQTSESLQRTARSEFDLKQADRLKDLVFEKAVLDNEAADTNIEFQIDENARRKLANTANVQKTMVEIQHEKLKMAKTDEERKAIQQSIDLLSHTKEVRILEEKLAAAGLRPSDPLYYRTLMGLLNNVTERLGGSPNAFKLF